MRAAWPQDRAQEASADLSFQTSRRRAGNAPVPAPPPWQVQQPGLAQPFRPSQQAVPAAQPPPPEADRCARQAQLACCILTLPASSPTTTTTSSPATTVHGCDRSCAAGLPPQHAQRWMTGHPHLPRAFQARHLLSFHLRASQPRRLLSTHKQLSQSAAGHRVVRNHSRRQPRLPGSTQCCKALETGSQDRWRSHPLELASVEASSTSWCACHPVSHRQARGQVN